MAPGNVLCCMFSSRVLDKYGIKHTGSWANVQANIRGEYGQMRIDRVYRDNKEQTDYTYEKAKILELYV